MFSCTIACVCYSFSLSLAAVAVDAVCFERVEKRGEFGGKFDSLFSSIYDSFQLCLPPVILLQLHTVLHSPPLVYITLKIQPTGVCLFLPNCSFSLLVDAYLSLPRSRKGFARSFQFDDDGESGLLSFFFISFSFCVSLSLSLFSLFGSIFNPLLYYSSCCRSMLPSLKCRALRSPTKEHAN